MKAIVGEGSLSPEECQFLDFADRFEAEFVHQGKTGRTIEETLTAGWRLLSAFPASALTRITKELIERYRRGSGDGTRSTDANGPPQH
jgi:V/A-type H+-transporting ATPase subunit B